MDIGGFYEGDFATKTLYRTGVYGQTFELYERFNVREK